MELKAILITLLSGTAFIIGYLVTKFFKKEKKLIVFSVGFSFVIILGLVFFDLLPECLELVSKKWLILCYALLGIIVLKVLDIFVPDHEHTSEEKHHMEHIGLISAIALVLHNVIEGTAIYTTALTDSKMGLFMALAVSCHNIPLGIQVSSLVKNKKEKFILLFILFLSSVIGLFLINIFKITLSESVLGVLISITLGMLIYISMFELICEIKEHIKEKILWYGIIFGVIISIISVLLG